MSDASVKKTMTSNTRNTTAAIALIDGEHYPQVIADTLAWLEEDGRYRLVALVFLGGTEKVSSLDRFEYRGLPLYAGGDMIGNLRRALDSHPADVVLDLSDEPVLGYRERFRLISETLAKGVSYRGADFFFQAPALPFLCDKVSIGVWGTGKRVGKTSLAAHVARRLAVRGLRLCIVTMGRGGPREPELLGAPPEITDEYLRGRVRQGGHAASDHFEDAMMADVVAIGCRRCGGGMAGVPFYSNVPEGALLACERHSDVVLFEGSGAANPPVGVDAVALVASAAQPEEYLLGYLGPYRLLRSDLLVVTMCEDFLVSSEKLRKLIDGVHAINPEVKVVKTIFRPRPLGDLSGRRVFLASTAPPGALEVKAEHLETVFGARVVASSPNLADRDRLAADLDGARDAEVLVTELKAAGVDTVSVYAEKNDKELVYLENVPVALDGDLEEEIDGLEALARRRRERR